MLHLTEDGQGMVLQPALTLFGELPGRAELPFSGSLPALPVAQLSGERGWTSYIDSALFHSASKLDL